MTQAISSIPHVLLLAGSGEARDIAAALSARKDLRVSASLLCAERSVGPLLVPTRLGRFGGASGLARFVQEAGIDAVLDATHPFAHRISAQAAQVCKMRHLPHAQVLRPAWVAGPDDHWTIVPDECAVAALLRPGQRVFATTGRATLDQLVTGSDAQFLVRRLTRDAAPAPAGNIRYVHGQGPFSVAQEEALLRDLRVDVLVVKNSGGASSRTKLDAARQLGLPVIVIARPPQPHGVTRLTSAQAALDWVAGLW